MLFISRRKNQSIVIGDDITVSVVDIGEGRVRLGIDVPNEESVRRSEASSGEQSLEALLDRFTESRPGPHQDEETHLPGIREIESLFRDKIADEGGHFCGFERRNGNYYIRSLVPGEEVVAKNDSIQSGVALRIKRPSIFICHYTLRRICTNGLMMRNHGFAREIRRVESPADDYAVQCVLAEISEAIAEFASPEHRTFVAQRMRAARGMSLEGLPHLEALRNRLRAVAGESVFRGIGRRFRSNGDSSLFGLVNAITATARDEADPGLKWRLEELGGEILTLVSVSDPTERASRETFVRKSVAA